MAAGAGAGAASGVLAWRATGFDAFDDLLRSGEAVPVLSPEEERRFLLDSWHKSTSDTERMAWERHVEKHARGRSALEYTADARRFFLEHRDLATPSVLKDGTMGMRIKFKVTVDGTKRSIGGYWTPEGRVVTFFDRG